MPNQPHRSNARIYVNGVPLHMKGVNWNPVGMGGYHPHGKGPRMVEDLQSATGQPCSQGLSLDLFSA